MEKAWILNSEMIGVVFKDNFSYHLRFPSSHVVIPNEVVGYVGNTKREFQGGCLVWAGWDYSIFVK